MILLIGCGNPLRRDDAAGIILIENVARRCRRPDLECITCHQLTPELAPRLAAPETSAVLFADAAVPDPFRPAALLNSLDEGSCGSLGHSLSPGTLLILAHRLYGSRPPAWLVTIPGDDFRFGRGLGTLSRKNLARAEAEVDRFLSGLEPSGQVTNGK